MDFSIITRIFGIYLEGLKNTLMLVSISLALGLMLAIPLAVLRSYGTSRSRPPIRAFVYFFRGTPLLVQMFLVYYGFGQFELINRVFSGLFSRRPISVHSLPLRSTPRLHHGDYPRRHRSHPPRRDRSRPGCRHVYAAHDPRGIVLPSAFRRALPAYSQRDDLHAARHITGQCHHHHRYHRCSTDRQFKVLQPLRGLSHRRRALYGNHLPHRLSGQEA